MIDYRLYDKSDGKSKLDHMRAMFQSALGRVPFGTVLMDSWYATKNVMLEIEKAQKVYFCPLKATRRVDHSGGTKPYQGVATLEWTAEEEQSGKRIKIHGFPKEHKVTLFRGTVSSHRTEYLVTSATSAPHDSSTLSLQDAHTVGALRWRIEEVHRESKQLTGIGKCQCRKARLQRNHIHCALLTWNGSNTMLTKPNKLFTPSSKDCCPSTSFSNLKTLR